MVRSKMRKLPWAGLACAVSMAVTGCYTENAYTGDRQVSSTAKGAGIGAAVGIVAGLLMGGDAAAHRKNALIAGGLGALAGGAVGNYMDKQQGELRTQLRGTGVSVTRMGNNLTLNMPGNITFATNSADLNGNFFRVLDSVNIVLKKYEKTLIEIAGHTDNVGSDSDNSRCPNGAPTPWLNIWKPTDCAAIASLPSARARPGPWRPMTRRKAGRPIVASN